MKKKSKVYLICGKTGAGKTTIAKLLEKELSAFRVSHDEWLLLTYGDNIPEDEFQECCKRISSLIWKQVARLYELNINIILEGWGGRKLRDDAREQLNKFNIEHDFIFVDCSYKTRLDRVQKRNRNLNDEGFFISENSFTKMEKIDEEFAKDEKCIIFKNENGKINIKTLTCQCT